jgi:type I site-specific restriction-modification system R (restriction) subunit
MESILNIWPTNCNRSNKLLLGRCHNKNTTELTEFAAAFLNPAHLGKMIAHYIVINETHKVMMILRPYQYFATEAIIQVKTLTTTLTFGTPQVRVKP